MKSRACWRRHQPQVQGGAERRLWCGLRGPRSSALKVSDIDSARMMIRVEQGKGRKDRNAMLSPMLLELLREWWLRRAARGAGCFLAANPVKPMTTRQLNRLPRGGRSGGDQKARDSAHAAAQLCNASLGADTDIRVIQVLSGTTSSTPRHATRASLPA